MPTLAGVSVQLETLQTRSDEAAKSARPAEIPKVEGACSDAIYDLEHLAAETEINIVYDK